VKKLSKWKSLLKTEFRDYSLNGICSELLTSGFIAKITENLSLTSNSEEMTSSYGCLLTLYPHIHSFVALIWLHNNLCFFYSSSIKALMSGLFLVLVWTTVLTLWLASLCYKRITFWDTNTNIINIRDTVQYKL
jgi:hypothetical protein